MGPLREKLGGLLVLYPSVLYLAAAGARENMRKIGKRLSDGMVCYWLQDRSQQLIKATASRIVTYL